jgi:hypothetical protein
LHPNSLLKMPPPRARRRVKRLVLLRILFDR